MSPHSLISSQFLETLFQLINCFILGLDLFLQPSFRWDSAGTMTLKMKNLLLCLIIFSFIVVSLQQSVFYLAVHKLYLILQNLQILCELGLESLLLLYLFCWELHGIVSNGAIWIMASLSSCNWRCLAMLRLILGQEVWFLLFFTFLCCCSWCSSFLWPRWCSFACWSFECWFGFLIKFLLLCSIFLILYVQSTICISERRRILLFRSSVRACSCLSFKRLQRIWRHIFLIESYGTWRYRFPLRKCLSCTRSGFGLTFGNSDALRRSNLIFHEILNLFGLFSSLLLELAQRGIQYFFLSLWFLLLLSCRHSFRLIFENRLDKLVSNLIHLFLGLPNRIGFASIAHLLAPSPWSAWRPNLFLCLVARLDSLCGCTPWRRLRRGSGARWWSLISNSLRLSKLLGWKISNSELCIELVFELIFQEVFKLILVCFHMPFWVAWNPFRFFVGSGTSGVEAFYCLKLGCLYLLLGIGIKIFFWHSIDILR